MVFKWSPVSPQPFLYHFFNHFKTTFWPPASAGPETISLPFFDHLFWRVPKQFFHHSRCSGPVGHINLISLRLTLPSVKLGVPMQKSACYLLSLMALSLVPGGAGYLRMILSEYWAPEVFQIARSRDSASIASLKNTTSRVTTPFMTQIMFLTTSTLRGNNY